MRLTEYDHCPGCAVSTRAPKEKVNKDGKKTKVGDGVEPSIKAIIDEEDISEEGEPGSNVKSFLFICKRCGYGWEEMR